MNTYYRIISILKSYHIMKKDYNCQIFSTFLAYAAADSGHIVGKFC